MPTNLEQLHERFLIHLNDYEQLKCQMTSLRELLQDIEEASNSISVEIAKINTKMEQVIEFNKSIKSFTAAMMIGAFSLMAFLIQQYLEKHH